MVQFTQVESSMGYGTTHKRPIQYLVTHNEWVLLLSTSTSSRSYFSIYLYAGSCLFNNSIFTKHKMFANLAKDYVKEKYKKDLFGNDKNHFNYYAHLNPLVK